MLTTSSSGLVLNEYCMGKRKEGTLGKEGKVKVSRSGMRVTIARSESPSSHQATTSSAFLVISSRS